MDLVRSQKELERIADLLLEEIKGQGDVVSRYLRVVRQTANFSNGEEHRGSRAGIGVNKEDRTRGIYTRCGALDLQPAAYSDLAVSRDLEEDRFNFDSKGIPLPTDTKVHCEPIPTGIEMHDAELKEFTRDHSIATINRELQVEQRVIVNSQGGVFIQSIPYMTISYYHGYSPIPSSRNIAVVCNTEDDIRRLPVLVNHFADPTPDKRIQRAGSMAEAFHELHKISKLKFGSLEEAGIPLSGLYDVVSLTGVPIHEVFGHHFEEPIWYLGFGDTGTFKQGQNVGNYNIVISDNPQQEIEGFRVWGFTHFDAYGRERPKRVHIENGKVKEFLGSEYVDTDKLSQALNLKMSPFVGNASQFEDGHFPQTRMSCTVLDGKTEDVDLDGKILMVPHGGHTNSDDKTYMVKGHECYVVRNGEPLRVIPLQVTGGINQALASMILLDDWSYQIGYCSKGEPIHYPRSRGTAQVPVSQLARNQLWRKQQVYPLPISEKHIKILQQ